MGDDQNQRTIQRIAEALGVSEHVFYECHDDQAALFNRDASQTLELLKLFSAIKDPKVRLNCLEYVRNCADGALSSTAEISDGGDHGN